MARKTYRKQGIEDKKKFKKIKSIPGYKRMLRGIGALSKYAEEQVVIGICEGLISLQSGKRDKRVRICCANRKFLDIMKERIMHFSGIELSFYQDPIRPSSKRIEPSVENSYKFLKWIFGDREADLRLFYNRPKTPPFTGSDLDREIETVLNTSLSNTRQESVNTNVDEELDISEETRQALSESFDLGGTGSISPRDAITVLVTYCNGDISKAEDFATVITKNVEASHLMNRL